MSTPYPGPGRVRQLANGLSRWRNTRRGTATLKAAYAQAARDMKRMDPAVRAAIGRAGIGKEDLKNLAQANTAAVYSPRAAQSAQQLNAWVSAQVQATTPEARRTFNPVKAVSNRISRWQDKRLGTATLKAAYAQARRDVKQMDPAVREAIGRSRIDKRELASLSRMQVAAPVGAGIQQAAQQHQARAWAEAQARAAGPRHAAAPDSAGQRVANAVNTASRWAKAAKSYPVEKAKKFQADYAERRQNPAGRHARPQAAQSGPQAQAQATQPVWTVQPMQPAQAQSTQTTQQLPTQSPQATQPFPAQTTQPVPAQSAQTTQPIPAQSAQTTQPIPAQSARTTQPVAAQGQATQPQTQGPAGQTAQQRSAEAKTFHAGLNNDVPYVGATPGGAAGSQEVTQRTAAPGSEQAAGGRHSSDAATKAFQGVASPAGSAKPGAAQSTGESTGGKHAERVGRHRQPDGAER